MTLKVMIGGRVMDKNKLDLFKNALAGVTLKVKTNEGDTVVGMLASKRIEQSLVSSVMIPFSFNVDDYFVLICEESMRASFLLASEIESIEHVR